MVLAVTTARVSAHRNQVAVSREAEAVSRRHPLVMLAVVALLAEKLQVLEVQRHRRVVDVVRRQVDLVVNDLAAGAAPLTQPVPVSDVSLPAPPPRFRLVEPPCPWFHTHHASPTGAQRAAPCGTAPPAVSCAPVRQSRTCPRYSPTSTLHYTTSVPFVSSIL